MDDQPPTEVSIREVIASDLAIFFAQHQDEDAPYMAAFTPPDPAGEAALIGH